jgi:hypothetical protein
VSAEIIPFVPRTRGRTSDEMPFVFRSRVQPDDLVMDHADTAPCEYAAPREYDANEPT